MSERAQAQEAREWQIAAYGDSPETWAALAFYRERGWPVDVNKWPERERVADRICAFKAGYRAALEAPPVGVSPQPDEYRERMRLHDLVLEVLAAWQESENEDDIVKRSRTRTAFRDRLKSPASLSPVESTPSREPLTGAELLDRFRPVEPTPELPRDDFTAPLPPRPPAVVKPQRYDLVRYGVTWEGQDNQPLLTPMPDGYWTPWHLAVEPPSVEPAPPAPCVWRVTGGALGNWVAPSCIAESIPAPWGTERATACHLCGKPMEISQ